MRQFTLAISALALLLSTAPPASPQSPPAMRQKVEKIAKELNLTPQQEMQLVPILRSEAPQVEAIKDNQSLTGVQKLEQLKTLHDRTDPQVRSILSSQQYDKLQEIRDRDIKEAIKNRAH
jgi:hypothetical protein